MHCVSVGHLQAGGAQDECPLPCGRLITASGMGLLPDLPKTALSPQQKLPKKMGRIWRAPVQTPGGSGRPCSGATNNLSGKCCWRRQGSTYQGKSGTCPHRVARWIYYWHSINSCWSLGCPLAQRLLLVFRHGNSRHDMGWAVSLHKSLIAHFDAFPPNSFPSNLWCILSWIASCLLILSCLCQMSPHLLCGEIWHICTWQIWINFRFLHICHV